MGTTVSPVAVQKRSTCSQFRPTCGLPRPRQFANTYTTSPTGYTAVCSERARCRMMGNSWRLPTCPFLLFAVLMANQVLTPQATDQDNWYANVESPALSVRYRPDGSRPISRMASFWRRSMLEWGPNEPHQPQLQFASTGDAAHLAWSTS